jgi:hypothetical protein
MFTNCDLFKYFDNEAIHIMMCVFLKESKNGIESAIS